MPTPQAAKSTKPIDWPLFQKVFHISDAKVTYLKECIERNDLPFTSNLQEELRYFVSLFPLAHQEYIEKEYKAQKPMEEIIAHVYAICLQEAMEHHRLQENRRYSAQVKDNTPPLIRHRDGQGHKRGGVRAN